MDGELVQVVQLSELGQEGFGPDSTRTLAWMDHEVTLVTMRYGFLLLLRYCTGAALFVAFLSHFTVVM